MKNKSCYLSIMMRDIYISLQKLLKIDLKTSKIAKLCNIFFRCVLFVAMATRHMILYSILFLNHEIQGLLFMYDDKRYPYQSTKVDKN